MMPADEYEAMWRSQGKAAADAEFNRRFDAYNRKERRKVAGVIIVICIIFALSFFI